MRTHFKYRFNFVVAAATTLRFAILARALALVLVVLAFGWVTTDSALAAVGKDFNQCRNGATPVTGNCEWSGGNLSNSQATYYEGMGSFQRVLYSGIASGTTHTVTINYQFSNQNAKKGYDFLISWAQASVLHQAATGITPTMNQCANLNTAFTAECNQLTGSSAFYTDVPLPDDPYVSDAGDGTVQSRINAFETVYGNRTIRLYSDCPFYGTPTFTISHLAPDTGDSDAQIIITYTTRAAISPESAPNCLTGGVSDNLMLQFAGHLALSGTCSQCWGVNKGAAAISGSGWHIRNMVFDNSGGSVDNQIQIAGFNPTAANLVSFKARTTDKGVRVKWETGTELNMVGFNVWRKSGTGDWKQLNTDTIDATKIGTVSGARYAYADKTAKPGKTYRYKLEILTPGKSEWSNVVKVQ